MTEIAIIVVLALVAMLVPLFFGLEQRRMRKIAETLNKSWINHSCDTERLRQNLQVRYDERMVHLQNAHRKIKRVQAENHTLRGLNRELNEETVSAHIELAATQTGLVRAESDIHQLQLENRALIDQRQERFQERNAYDHAFGVMDDEIRSLDARLADLSDVAADMVGGLVEASTAKSWWYAPINLDFSDEVRAGRPTKHSQIKRKARK